MDKTALVGPDIEEGRRFLDLLGKAEIPMNAALWQRDEAFGRWSLIIVTPLVEHLGARETYRRLDQILSKVPDGSPIDLLNVSAMTPDAWFSKSLHRELRNVRDRAVAGLPVGDHIVDGFIYFVK